MVQPLVIRLYEIIEKRDERPPHLSAHKPDELGEPACRFYLVGGFCREEVRVLVVTLEVLRVELDPVPEIDRAVYPPVIVPVVDRVYRNTVESGLLILVLQRYPKPPSLTGPACCDTLRKVFFHSSASKKPVSPFSPMPLPFTT